MTDAALIELSPHAPPTRPLVPVRDLPARVKKITTTDEGRLQIVLEAESLGDQTIPKVQELLWLQQERVTASFAAVQGDLFAEDADRGGA